MRGLIFLDLCTGEWPSKNLTAAVNQPLLQVLNKRAMEQNEDKHLT